jgi:hypothetical protein
MRLWALDASATLMKICPASVEVRPRSRYYDANGSNRQMGCRSGLQGSCSCRTPSILRALASRRLRFLPRVKSYVFWPHSAMVDLDLRCTKGKLDTIWCYGAETASASEASPAGSLEAVDCWRQGWDWAGQGRGHGRHAVQRKEGPDSLPNAWRRGQGRGGYAPASFPAPRVNVH